AREFRVVGSDGKVRATLSPSEKRWGGVDDGMFGTATTALRLYEHGGSPRAILGAAWEETGRSLEAGGTLTLSGRREGPVLHLGADGEAATIVLQGDDGNWVALGGKTRHGLIVGDGFTKGNQTTLGGGAGFEAVNGSITFFDYQGRPTATLPKTSSADDSAELTRLLREFLAGASRNDPAVHERFWADDLVYTGSSGRRIGKADILSD